MNQVAVVHLQDQEHAGDLGGARTLLLRNQRVQELADHLLLLAHGNGGKLLASEGRCSQRRSRGS